jgi:allantoinase
VLLTAGHHERGLPLTRIAEMIGGWPAQRFGLERKGSIAVGNDADLVLVDMAASYTLREGSLLQRHRLSPYIGQNFKGVVRQTLLRGQPIFADGKITATALGRFAAAAPVIN